MCKIKLPIFLKGCESESKLLSVTTETSLPRSLSIKDSISINRFTKVNESIDELLSSKGKSGELTISNLPDDSFTILRMA